MGKSEYTCIYNKKYNLFVAFLYLLLWVPSWRCGLSSSFADFTFKRAILEICFWGRCPFWGYGLGKICLLVQNLLALTWAPFRAPSQALKIVANILLVVNHYLHILGSSKDLLRFSAIRAIDLLGRPNVWGLFCFLGTVGYWNAVLWFVAWFCDRGSGWLCILPMISHKLVLIWWPNWSCRPELLKIDMAGEFKWAQFSEK